MLQKLFIPQVNAQLAYRYRPGTQSPIVIFHGIGGSSIEEYASLFDREDLVGWPLLAIDLIGFGHSDKPDAFAYSLDAQADAISTLFTALGLSPAIILGHSLGGSLAMIFAKRYPQRVRALIMAEAGLEFKYLVLSRWAARYQEEVFASQFEALMSGTDGGLLGGFSTQPTMKMTSALAFYRTSVSLIAAAKGDVLLAEFYNSHLWRTFWIGEKTRDRYGDAFLQELDRRGISWSLLKGAGHQLILEQPEHFGAMLAGFVRTLPGDQTT
jgi:pimeloyl-ACP methyl ester carboxylesterase